MEKKAVFDPVHNLQLENTEVTLNVKAKRDSVGEKPKEKKTVEMPEEINTIDLDVAVKLDIKIDNNNNATQEDHITAGKWRVGLSKRCGSWINYSRCSAQPTEMTVCEQAGGTLSPTELFESGVI